MVSTQINTTVMNFMHFIICWQFSLVPCRLIISTKSLHFPLMIVNGVAISIYLGLTFTWDLVFTWIYRRQRVFTALESHSFSLNNPRNSLSRLKITSSALIYFKGSCAFIMLKSLTFSFILTRDETTSYPGHFASSQRKWPRYRPVTWPQNLLYLRCSIMIIYAYKYTYILSVITMYIIILAYKLNAAYIIKEKATI